MKILVTIQTILLLIMGYIFAEHRGWNRGFNDCVNITTPLVPITNEDNLK